LIVARPEAVVRAGLLLSTAFLTANAMPCWMARLVIYLRSHLDSENLQKSHECFLAASREYMLQENRWPSRGVVREAGCEGQCESDVMN
jgi:hypothetical protein